uniref:Uncharacterized protein n=1 Tax=Setaria italica TaxID=4555 RepID=K3Z1C1_SETIT
MAFLIFSALLHPFLPLSISSPLSIHSSTTGGQQVVQDLVSVNTSQHRRMIDGDCGTGNPVDDC